MWLKSWIFSTVRVSCFGPDPNYLQRDCIYVHCTRVLSLDMNFAQQQITATEGKNQQERNEKENIHRQIISLVIHTYKCVFPFFLAHTKERMRKKNSLQEGII